eukprot:Hpha_TRINITY_DN18671_c0_g1::TRINITY_DN18671_c0_g1_i1::g.115635::m.115635
MGMHHTRHTGSAGWGQGADGRRGDCPWTHTRCWLYSPAADQGSVRFRHPPGEPKEKHAKLLLRSNPRTRVSLLARGGVPDAYRPGGDLGIYGMEAGGATDTWRRGRGGLSHLHPRIHVALNVMDPLAPSQGPLWTVRCYPMHTWIIARRGDCPSAQRRGNQRTALRTDAVHLRRPATHHPTPVTRDTRTNAPVREGHRHCHLRSLRRRPFLSKALCKRERCRPDVARLQGKVAHRPQGWGRWGPVALIETGVSLLGKTAYRLENILRRPVIPNGEQKCALTTALEVCNPQRRIRLRTPLGDNLNRPPPGEAHEGLLLHPGVQLQRQVTLDPPRKVAIRITPMPGERRIFAFNDTPRAALAIVLQELVDGGAPRRGHPPQRQPVIGPAQADEGTVLAHNTHVKVAQYLLHLCTRAPRRHIHSVLFIRHQPLKRCQSVF